MDQFPAAVRRLLTRLRRRLALGLFLDVWPNWAAATLLAGGTVAVVCRMFFASAAPWLAWLWAAPIVVAVPVMIISMTRAYRPGEVAALADWLGGGQGLLLTLFERNDPAWAESALIGQASRFALPGLRLGRAAALLVPAVAFLAVALLLPQRVASQAESPALAEQIGADLTNALVELKQQNLITPAEEQRLEEEIQRIRRSAEERVDASAWEAADALREQVVANLSEKQDAVKWAQESLARFAAAAQAGGSAESSAAAQSELMKALEKLGQNGLLAGAPESLRGLLKDGKLPTDPKALQALADALGQQLAAANGRFGDLAKLGKEFGRFDPAEFPVEAGVAADGDGLPGRGGINRGRADAELTWGQETARFDKFKSQPLPPGAARTPDDWAPVVVLPGAPQESPILSAQSAAREYSAAAGQAAWRRSLAPRHQTAVKKYFERK